tara:strand:- start:269 stop:757 length:489 start_codon:yes stop_codon:yes gene_type:complete
MKELEKVIREIGTYVESNVENFTPVFLIGVFLWICIVVFIISRFAWHKFADKYESETPAYLDKIGIISAKIGKVNYNNSLVVSCNKTGIFIKPLLIFSIGHKPLFIPFRDITKTELHQRFGMKSIIISFRDENLPTITVRQKTWETVTHLSGYQNRDLGAYT